MIIGGRKFDFDDHFYIMGILNVTPDSFSDGGKYDELDQALFHAEQMIEDGAHIIDVGGESTRPGHVKITDEEEIERVCPIIEKIKGWFDVPISLDTYKASVAAAGIKSGADLINDIWGLKWDIIGKNSMADMYGLHNIYGGAYKDAYEESSERMSMAQVIADAGVPCCLMHNRMGKSYRAKIYNGLHNANAWKDDQDMTSLHNADNSKGDWDIASLHNTDTDKNCMNVNALHTAEKFLDNDDNPYGYNNFMEDVLHDIQESIDIALESGIARDNIIIDPGIGFAKDLGQNLVTMNHLSELCKLGYPILLGTSRKSMIGLTLDLPVEEREEGTIATSVIGYQAGCRIFRVHDVRANLRALKMTEAIMNIE